MFFTSLRRASVKDGGSKGGTGKIVELLVLKGWWIALFACLPSAERIKLPHVVVHQEY